MERIKYTDTRIVDGITYTVECLEILEYNGQWVSNGYRIWQDKTFCHLYGWPTNNDLRNLTINNSLV